ncbi:unnamed protein product, partial [marine sediment metagenome]
YNSGEEASGSDFLSWGCIAKNDGYTYDMQGEIFLNKWYLDVELNFYPDLEDYILDGNTKTYFSFKVTAASSDTRMYVCTRNNPNGLWFQGTTMEETEWYFSEAFKIYIYVGEKTSQSQTRVSLDYVHIRCFDSARTEFSPTGPSNWNDKIYKGYREFGFTTVATKWIEGKDAYYFVDNLPSWAWYCEYANFYVRMSYEDYSVVSGEFGKIEVYDWYDQQWETIPYCTLTADGNFYTYSPTLYDPTHADPNLRVRRYIDGPTTSPGDERVEIRFWFKEYESGHTHDSGDAWKVQLDYLRLDLYSRETWYPPCDIGFNFEQDINGVNDYFFYFEGWSNWYSYPSPPKDPLSLLLNGVKLGDLTPDYDPLVTNHLFTPNLDTVDIHVSNGPDWLGKQAYIDYLYLYWINKPWTIPLYNPDSVDASQMSKRKYDDFYQIRPWFDDPIFGNNNIKFTIN